MENINNINVETAVELIKTNKDLKLLDIRGPYEAKATGFIEGSMLLDPNDRQIIETIENLDKNKEYLLYCAIYFSDHSEAVDQGLEHDANNFVYDMVEIPMYIYLSDEYIQSYSNKFDNIQKAQKYLFTNDLIFNTVLGVMDINIENMYEVENDITNEKYDYKSNRFKTMYNKKDIIVSN